MRASNCWPANSPTSKNRPTPSFLTQPALPRRLSRRSANSSRYSRIPVKYEGSSCGSSLSKHHPLSFEAAVLSRLTWRLVPFLFSLYIFAYLDRTTVGFAPLQMREQLIFTVRVFGLGAGMFFAGYFCSQVPSNLVLHRVGARRWIAMLMIVWGMISSSMALVAT